MNRQIGSCPIRRASLLAMLLSAGCHGDANTKTVGEVPQLLVVRPGASIQVALDEAAERGIRMVRVEPGTYRPDRPAQALVWFNAKHNGITLEADGEVVLTAANPDVADPESESFPAIVNHVVYFGDGVGRGTAIRGFRIAGANGFVTREGPEIQPETGLERLAKERFYYTDGGGVKVFGRSSPTIENVELCENFASPCGGGISIEHRGFDVEAVIIRNCVFRGNRARLTGSALDVLPGSAAIVENCLFVDNLGNLGTDNVSPVGEEFNREHGSGAMTVFYQSRVSVSDCTFTANWNGLDDKGRENTYDRCIFWMNTRPGGLSPGGRYEIDILDGHGVRDCMLNGAIIDLRGTVPRDSNTFEAPDPRFDSQYVPQSPDYAGVGYRPVASAAANDAAPATD